MGLQAAVLHAQLFAKTESKTTKEIEDNDEANPKPEDFESGNVRKRGRFGRKFGKTTKTQRILKAGGPGSGWFTEGGHVSHLMNKDVINTPVVPSPGKHAAAGIIVKNSKGHVLIYSPKNNFGGYKNTFSKGTIEQGQSPQEAAIRELQEETGIVAKITGHLGQVERSTSTTRYYTGEQVGGQLTPSDESVIYRYEPIDDKLSDLLRNTSGKKTGDHEVLNLMQKQFAPEVSNTAANIMDQKLGGAKGTNQGGLYKGKDGRERYVKFYNNPGQGHAEAAANSIYRSLGVSAPNSTVFNHKDGEAFASDIISGGTTLQDKGLTKDRAREVLKGFAADVLLGNWDSVGLVYDNILLTKDGKAHRVDNGASFQYRAQGGTKPSALLHTASEYEGFFNPAINREYSQLAKAAGYKSADEIPDIKKQVSAIVTLEQTSGGWDNYLSQNAPYLSQSEHKLFSSMLTARTKDLSARHPLTAAKAVFAAIALEAGGPGSGWTTENGHVSHKTGSTHSNPTVLGPASKQQLQDLGFQYHHTHQVTLNHKKVNKDYYVNNAKNHALAISHNDWALGKIHTTSKYGPTSLHETSFKPVAQGADKSTIKDALQQQGYKTDVVTPKTPLDPELTNQKIAQSKGPKAQNGYYQSDVDAMHKTFTEGDGYTYQKTTTSESGAVNHIYTKPNPDAGGAFAKAIQENPYGPPNIINMGKTQYNGDPLKIVPTKAADKPEFSPKSNAQTWLKQKADELASKGYIYKSSKQLTNGDGYWHKYAAPGSTKESSTTIILVEKPGGTHELTVSPSDEANGLKDESKVDSIESPKDTVKLQQATYSGHLVTLENKGFAAIAMSKNADGEDSVLWKHPTNGLSVTSHKGSGSWKLFDGKGTEVSKGFGSDKLTQVINKYAASPNDKPTKPTWTAVPTEDLDNLHTYLTDKNYKFKETLPAKASPWLSILHKYENQYGEKKYISENPNDVHGIVDGTNYKPGGSKEVDSQEGIPKDIKVITDKAYRTKVASAVAQVIKDNPPNKLGSGHLLGYSSDGQMDLRMKTADALGVPHHAIIQVQHDIDNWTGSSHQTMRNDNQKIINGDKDANPAWLIEHEVTKQQLKAAYGDTLNLYRGISTGGYNASPGVTSQALSNQIQALKLLANSAAEFDAVKIKSLGSDSWTSQKSTSHSFSGDGIKLHIPKVPIDYIMTSHETNGKFGSGESEFVVAYPKALIPVSKDNILAGGVDPSLSSKAAIMGAIGMLRKYGWKIDIKGKTLIIHDRAPNWLHPDKIQAGGPGSGRHKAFGTPKIPKTISRPPTTAKHEAALKNYKPTTVKDHARAARGEQMVRDAVGGVITADNMPFDVLTPDGKHAIEVKTLGKNTNDKITMRKAALNRKFSWATKNQVHIHTVVLDMRKSSTPKAVYYRAGVGSFRVGNMTSLADGLQGISKAMRSK